MRRCFYDTDLGQNAVFHNFEIQIADSFNFRKIEARVGFSESAVRSSSRFH